MKIISEINDGPLKTTIFGWNNKYLIKYEIENLEQTYKVPIFDVSGEEEIKELAKNPDFLKTVADRFQSMAKDFYTRIG